MRIESSITAISWIPSEAIEGITKLPFEAGLFHYDAPPPDQLDESALDRLHKEDAFREANHLRAWIDVTDGKLTGYGGGLPIKEKLLALERRQLKLL